MTSVNADIKLVAIDLDGTLLLDNRNTAPENVAAIHQAEAQGVTVVICTGRPYPSADAVATRLGLTSNPIISYNGALVRMPSGGEVLFSQPLPPDLAAQVVEDCVARQLQIHYFLDDVMYVPRVSAGARLYWTRTGIKPVPVGDQRKLAGNSPTKILVYAGPEVVRELRPEFEGRYEDKLYITTSMPEYLEFLHPEVSKGDALRPQSGLSRRLPPYASSLSTAYCKQPPVVVDCIVTDPGCRQAQRKQLGSAIGVPPSCSNHRSVVSYQPRPSTGHKEPQS